MVLLSIIDFLLDAIRTGAPPSRHAAAALLCAYVSHSRADLSPHVPQLLRGLLLLLAETERDVLMMAWEALQVTSRFLQLTHAHPFVYRANYSRSRETTCTAIYILAVFEQVNSLLS